MRVGAALVVALLPFVLVAFRRILGEAGAPLSAQSLLVVYLGLVAIVLGTRNALRPLFLPPPSRVARALPRVLAAATVLAAFARETPHVSIEHAILPCLGGVVLVSSAVSVFVSLARRGTATEPSRDTLWVSGTAAVLFVEFFCVTPTIAHVWTTHAYGFVIAGLLSAELVRRISAWAHGS